MENNNEFLPSDYQPPKGESRYMKFQSGTNKFRILSRPIIGWEDWEDKKPLRFKMKEKPEKPIDPKYPIKHFWAMIVWNYQTEHIEILEITQVTIMQSIVALTKDPEWGSPFHYNIKVEKQGEKLETKYSVLASPPSDLTNEIKEAYKTTPVNLEALYEGEDPFDTELPNVDLNDLPF